MDAGPRRRRREDRRRAALDAGVLSADGEHPRDLVGYGRHLPDPQWPGGARLALTIAVNYEAGAESNILDGDTASEGALSDTPFPAYEGERSILVESAYEYGSRRGIWRLLDLIEERGITANLFGVVQALERNPAVARAFAGAGHEVVAHGYRWIDHRSMPEDAERDHIRRCVEGVERLTGTRPVGYMAGRPSMNTRRLVAEAGFLYDRDALNDELPYWTEAGGRPHLVIPYSYVDNDMRYGTPMSPFTTGGDFFVALRETFDVLYAEGAREPKLMSIGLHDRTAGRPGRAGAVARFLDHVLAHDGVWICTGAQVAEHWRTVHPPAAG